MKETYSAKMSKDTALLIRKIKDIVGDFSDDTIINVALAKQYEYLKKVK